MELVKPGTWKVIRTNGKETMYFAKPTIRDIEEAIHAECLDTVILDRENQQILMVDDTGMCDGKEPNPAATKLYHAICKPGTTHQIHGDVAIVNDADFA